MAEENWRREEKSSEGELLCVLGHGAMELQYIHRKQLVSTSKNDMNG